MYKTRLVEEELESLLATFGAVVIEGPKASGKTTFDAR
jgi:predicted AAA+ superfamily ATPase